MVSVFALQAQSACTFFDDFKDNKNGTVTDPRNGLIWKRCAEGFNWNGNVCQGSKKDMGWYAALEAAKHSRFLGKSDWRIPTKAELKAVVGNRDDCKDNKAGQYAASNNIAHPVTNKGFSELFWSSSPDVGSAGDTWAVNFDDGDAYSELRNVNYHGVRLVRASQSSGGEAALEFNSEYAKIGEYKREKIAKTAREAQERQETARQHAYANSPAGRADAQRQQQARQMCEAQKQTCMASCPAYNYNAPSFDANRTHFQCESRCSQISCN